ncbi:MAG: hypothetical protein E5V37_18500 [Mesorhizobium sp.]|nr:MAG: hypothetical protein E5V37_18500 [Mesorhizobium sp.]
MNQYRTSADVPLAPADSNATVLDYDVRGAMVLYGLPGTPCLRKWDCDRLWAQYGGALLQP